jgi:hypothetical protein
VASEEAFPVPMMSGRGKRSKGLWQGFGTSYFQQLEIAID